MRKVAFIISFVIILSINLHARKEFNINEHHAQENFKKGVNYYHNTKFLSAIEYFIKSLQYVPDFHQAKVWMGKAYYKAGYFDNAMSEWQDVVSQGGADNILINQLNNIYFKIGQSKRLPSINSYIHLKTIQGNQWKDLRFLQPSSLFIDHNDEIFVSGLASSSIVRLDVNYNFIRKYTKGEKSFKMPYGIIKDSRDYLYVSDVNRDIVQKISKDGKGIITIGTKGTNAGAFLGPEGLCIDKDDNLYVADTGNARIQKFSSDGTFLMKFGRRGEKPGRFFKPVGITLDPENNIYIADQINKNIQKFDSDGNFIEYMYTDKMFSDMKNIHYMDDYFLVADGINGAFIYDKGNSIWQNFKYFNYSRDKFFSVSDLMFGNNKNLYILDYLKSTMEIFTPEKYKYSNLEPRIDAVDISGYPQIALYCSVYKNDGSPIVGLSDNNFSVKELGVKIYPLEIVKSIYDEDTLTMLFLVEKSFEMKKFNDEIKDAASFFMKDILENKDLVRILNFHKNTWQGIDYNYQKLKILDALGENNYHYITDVSRPLYTAITETMNKLSRKVIVYFTTGEFDPDKNFKYHDFEVCKKYAKINHVPFFIVNFTQKNESRLKAFARDSLGEYYYYFNDVKKMKNIRKEIFKVPANNYILVYETLKNRRLIDTWREIDLEVYHNKLTGVDRTGYYVPKH